MVEGKRWQTYIREKDILWKISNNVEKGNTKIGNNIIIFTNTKKTYEMSFSWVDDDFKTILAEYKSNLYAPTAVIRFACFLLAYIKKMSFDIKLEPHLLYSLFTDHIDN